jgi:hypothetical protein
MAGVPTGIVKLGKCSFVSTSSVETRPQFFFGAVPMTLQGFSHSDLVSKC